MVLVSEIIMLPPRRNSYSGSSESSSSEKSKSPTKNHWWFFGSKLKSHEVVGGSNQHIATQKLRESKWFHENEEKIVCAVMETGFIVEIKLDSPASAAAAAVVVVAQENSNSVAKNDDQSQNYGIVSVEMKKKDKKATSNDLFLYTVKKVENKYKIVKTSFVQLWKDGYVLRINNMNDKTKHINAEKHIKNQITYAIKHKTNFHNSLHFVDYCRYGAQLEERKKLVSESVKWGGISASFMLLHQRERSNSYSK